MFLTPCSAASKASSIATATAVDGGTSVPVEMAYLYAIPFVIGIVLCLIGAFYFKKNHVNIIIRRYNHG